MSRSITKHVRIVRYQVIRQQTNFGHQHTSSDQAHGVHGAPPITNPSHHAFVKATFAPPKLTQVNVKFSLQGSGSLLSIPPNA